MFTREDLLKIAGLAKLEVSEEELESLLQEMEEIVAFAGQIAEASPESYPLSSLSVCPLREDRPDPCFPQNEILREASGQREGYYEIFGIK